MYPPYTMNILWTLVKLVTRCYKSIFNQLTNYSYIPLYIYKPWLNPWCSYWKSWKGMKSLFPHISPTTPQTPCASDSRRTRRPPVGFVKSLVENVAPSRSVKDWTWFSHETSWVFQIRMEFSRHLFSHWLINRRLSPSKAIKLDHLIFS